MMKKNTTSRHYFSICPDKECRGVWREVWGGLKPKSKTAILRKAKAMEVYRGQPEFSQPLTRQALTPSIPPSLRSVGHSSFIIAPSDLPPLGRSLPSGHNTKRADPLGQPSRYLCWWCVTLSECQTLADNALKLSLEVEPDAIDITVYD